MTGWIAAIAGFIAFGAVARNAVKGTKNSSIDTPWYVPQSAEDYINDEAARIQREQKQLAQDALMKAVAVGGLVMLGVGLGLGAVGNYGQKGRYSR